MLMELQDIQNKLNIYFLEQIGKLSSGMMMMRLMKRI